MKISRLVLILHPARGTTFKYHDMGHDLDSSIVISAFFEPYDVVQ